MQGLTFEVEERVAPSAPERADVACFVGYVRRRPDAPVTTAVQRFLFEAGWTQGPAARVDPLDPQDPLLDVPVPVETFDAFARLFAWEARSTDEADGATYLGAVPEPLLAIPVLEVELNGDGSVRRIEILREPRQAKDTLKIAVDAVRRAAPFGDVSRLPRPWKFTETFLFDDARKFKPRTLDR